MNLKKCELNKLNIFLIALTFYGAFLVFNIINAEQGPTYQELQQLASCTQKNARHVPLNFEKEGIAYAEAKDYQLCFLYPINATRPDGERLSLSIILPRDFRSIPQPPISPLNEFIPKSDTDVNNWSEIITPVTHVGKRVSAPSLINLIKQGILKDGGKVIEDQIQHYNDYSTATLIMVYTDENHKNRREVAYAKFFSGPFDCAGLNYAIALSKDVTEADAIKKIKQYVEANTALIKF